MQYTAVISKANVRNLDETSPSGIMRSLSEDVNQVKRLLQFYERHKSALMSQVTDVEIFKLVRHGRMYTCEIERRDQSKELIAAAGVKDYLVPVFDGTSVRVPLVMEAGAMLSAAACFGLQRKLHAIRLFDALATDDPDFYLSATFGANKISANNMLDGGIFEEWTPPFAGMTELRREERRQKNISDTEIRWFRPTRAGVIELGKQLLALHAGQTVDRTEVRATSPERFKAKYEFDLPKFDQVEFRLSDEGFQPAIDMARRLVEHEVPVDEVDAFFGTKIFR